ncbi:MAG: hypothetical protein Q8933_20305 [Bacteroidota bacterium]|nr:hypothetical protein [Bacteroidota bacterium]MDP4197586.1 hypothetical protein [Bacteroidota bacterium]
MLNKLLLLLVFVSFLTSGCASIPKESVELNQQISKAIASNYRAYVDLLNEYFLLKRDQINSFIDNKYLPTEIKNIQDQLKDAGEDPDKFQAFMVKDIIDKVDLKRESMLKDLEKTRLLIMERISQNYNQLQQANNALTALLQSAINVNEAASSLTKDIRTSGKNEIAIDELEKCFNEYLSRAGSKAESAISLYEVTKQILDKAKEN